MTYDRSKLVWVSKKGEKFVLKDIPYRYLVNIMGFLLKFGATATTDQGMTATEWLQIISEEMSYREKHKVVAENSPGKTL